MTNYNVFVVLSVDVEESDDGVIVCHGVEVDCVRKPTGDDGFVVPNADDIAQRARDEVESLLFTAEVSR